MQTFRLFLSALISSWQFFKESAPAPRIEFTLNKENNATSIDSWQEVKASPEKLTIIDFIKNIFYNPHWNEYLYIMDCAERLIIEDKEFYSNEISNFINRYLIERNCCTSATPYLKFRVIFNNSVLFRSEYRLITELDN